MKQVTVPGARDATGGGWAALVTALAVALLAMWIADGGLLPSPPPVPVPTW